MHTSVSQKCVVISCSDFENGGLGDIVTKEHACKPLRKMYLIMETVK
jgi:hypothetical protein